MIIELSGTKITGGIYLNGKFLKPAKSLKIINHSPDGFSWGYNGSGPSQLALAILLELTDKETALKNYQRFKRDVIANITQGNFETNIDVTEYVGEIPGKEPFLNNEQK